MNGSEGDEQREDWKRRQKRKKKGSEEEEEESAGFPTPEGKTHEASEDLEEKGIEDYFFLSGR